MGMTLDEEPAGSLLCGFAFALIGPQILLHSVVTLVLEADLQEFPFHCCSNRSQNIWSMWKSNPGVSVVSTQRPNFNLNSVFTIQATGRNFQHGSNFCFRGSILLVMVIRLPLEGCIHDKPTSWNCVKSPVSFVLKCCPTSQDLEILHPYKIYSIYVVVIASQFVLHLVATEKFGTLSHHSPKELLSWSHWAQLIAPSQKVALFIRERIRILHTSPRLLRKDWADLQKQSCEKSQSFPERLQSVSTIYHLFCFCVDLRTMES